MGGILSSRQPLSALQQYVIVTANYWAFTLTDGALRMLVVFHFHALGYSTLEIAFLFLFYEFFGIITNLYGGWLGARFGLRLTLWSGTLLQIGALLMLIPIADSWPKWWSVAYVMVAQAISGIAKDLNKMSAKSAIKTVVKDAPEESRPRPAAAVPLGGDPHRLQKCPQGSGLLPGGSAADHSWLQPLRGRHGRRAVRGLPLHPGAAPGDGPDETEAWLYSPVLQVPGDQRALPGALLPLRGPRCLVRGGLAGVSAGRPGLEVLWRWAASWAFG